jgi:hypothetical protein
VNKNISELKQTILEGQTWCNHLVLSPVELVIGSIIFKLMQDGGMAKIIKIADLRHKMSQNRKRRNPRAYVRWSAKQSCIDYVEYVEK